MFEGERGVAALKLHQRQQHVRVGQVRRAALGQLQQRFTGPARLGQPPLAQLQIARPGKIVAPHARQLVRRQRRVEAILIQQHVGLSGHRPTP